jgi:hypothetical protein
MVHIRSPGGENIIAGDFVRFYDDKDDAIAFLSAAAISITTAPSNRTPAGITDFASGGRWLRRIEGFYNIR